MCKECSLDFGAGQGYGSTATLIGPGGRLLPFRDAGFMRLLLSVALSRLSFSFSRIRQDYIQVPEEVHRIIHDNITQSPSAITSTRVCCCWQAAIDASCAECASKSCLLTLACRSKFWRRAGSQERLPRLYWFARARLSSCSRTTRHFTPCRIAKQFVRVRINGWLGPSTGYQRQHEPT